MKVNTQMITRGGRPKRKYSVSRPTVDQLRRLKGQGPVHFFGWEKKKKFKKKKKKGKTLLDVGSKRKIETTKRKGDIETNRTLVFRESLKHKTAE